MTEGIKEALRDFDPICAMSYNVYLMTPPFFDLLKRIAGGLITYEPFRLDAEGLREFQDKEATIRFSGNPSPHKILQSKGNRKYLSALSDSDDTDDTCKTIRPRLALTFTTRAARRRGRTRR